MATNFLTSIQKSLQTLNVPKLVQQAIAKTPQAQAVKILTPYVQKATAAVTKAATPVVQKAVAQIQTAMQPKPAQIISPLPNNYVYTPPKPATPTQSFGQLNKTNTTGNKATGGGAIIASAGGGGNKQSAGTVMGVTIKASDINPQTGLPYAINPVTGEWDDGYFNYIKKLMGEQNVPLTTIQAMQKYSPANIKYGDIEKEEFAKATPYYERLLRESNWDIDQAKAKMKEDYDLGVKVERQNRDYERTQLVTQTAPAETLSAQDELAKRGMLDTVEGEAAPLTTQLSGGEEIKAKTGLMGKSYGGLAGGRLGTLLQSQTARTEAITNAQKAREAEMEIPYRYGTTGYEEERKRKAAELEQAKRKETAAAAAERYGRETAIAGQKVEGLMQPYL
jgi:hypothetical protein